MTFLPVLNGSPLVIWPSTPMGWAGWLALLVLTGWVVWRGWWLQPSLDRRFWRTFFILALLVPPASLLVGVRLPGTGMPLPGLPQELPGPALMVFAAIPWVLAGGMLGPLGGALMGASSGIFSLLFGSHSQFAPLELALMGALFSLAVRQRFRTPAFRALSQPIVAAILLAILYPALYVAGAFLVASGSVAARLDFGLSGALAASAALGAELLIAGLVGQIHSRFYPAAWGRDLPLEPSPAERSLETRFQIAAGTLIVALLVSLMAGSWIISGRAARGMLDARLGDIAAMTAAGVPYFLETGQNLAAQIASGAPFSSDSAAGLETYLAGSMSTTPYFSQLIALDGDGSQLAAYPASAGETLALAPEESNGMALARAGVSTQTYAILPESSGGPPRIAFIAADQAADGGGHILLARTALADNPVSQPFITALEGVEELGGQGMLIDENGRAIYHTDPALTMSPYLGQTGEQALLYDDTAPDGTRRLVYYQPVPGSPWAVALTVPAQVAQQLALGIAAPLSLMVLVLAAAALVFLRVGLRGVTLSLRSLAGETERIAAGDLGHSLPVLGVDEVGQLTGSFEQMRASLRARLDELNRLLAVSQGVASSLDLAEAIRPVLDAALATGASAARMVVVPATGLGYEPEGPSRFGAGAAHEAYAHMDDAVMGLARRQDRVALSTLHRVRGLELDPLAPQPASLIAVALRHESRFYGVLWAAYDKARAFAETDVSYLSTLAGQAALAAANAHLFLSAEVGRERLAAILSSTPDPVLVTDSKNRLLFANPAAWQALGAAVGTGEGQPVEGMISEKPLLDLLLAVREDNSSVEVELPGGRVYLATASPVAAEGRLVGRVCILRDVTYFKELDAMKSEFVSTVSHDLRSPLTLMRGYATMLEMVGELNEQQQSYTGKIIVGVENMARLINNLLDLGRIEVGVGLRIEAVDVAEVVDGVIGALQPQAAGKNIEIEVDLPAGKAPALEADAGLFQQAIFNLVDNAIKYTAPGGKVSLRLTVKPDLMGLEVKDNGIGVPTADLPRLFEKFYRGSQREARQERGSGLGLAIVRSIVEKHGGRVWVESRPGRGSRFFVEMPWKQPDRG